MPTVLRSGAYRVFFYSADCAEPAHVHVQRDRYIAKLWLHDCSVASAGGFPAVELARVVRLVGERLTNLREAWVEHCHR